jgi:autotransporter translocation and assembly factor TamB
MRRFIYALLVLVLGVAGLVWVERPRLINWLRLRLEHEITTAVSRRTTIGELQVSLFPVRVQLAGLSIGEEPSLARVDRLAARLWSLASLAEGRPVVTLEVDSPVVDLSHLPKSAPPARPTTPSGGGRVPPLHLKNLTVTQAHLRFLMGKTVADLTVANLAGRVKSGLLGGSVAAAAEVQGVELQRKSYQVKLEEIRADGGADAGGLFVNSASVKGERLYASVNATAIPHRHAVAATFDPGVLGVVVDELSVLSGAAQLDGTLTGDLASAVLDGRLRIRDGAIGHHLLGDLDTHVVRKRATLSFDDLRLVGAAGHVSGAVDLTIEKEVPIHGALQWEGVDLERLLTVIGQPLPMSNGVNATTRVDGALDPLDLVVEGSGALLVNPAGTPKTVGEFELGGRIHPHDLDARLEVRQSQRNNVAARVLIDGNKFAGGVSLQAADLAALNAILPRPVRLLALTGQAEAKAEFSGTTEHPAVSGAVTLRNPTVVGTGVSGLRGDFVIAADTLSTKGVTIEAAAGDAQFSGVLALAVAARNDWRLELRDLGMELVLNLVRGLGAVTIPAIEGTLNGTVVCRDPWRQAHAQADLTVRSLRLGHQPIERVELHATTAFPRWTLQLSAVHAANERVAISGSGEGLARVQLAIDSTPLNLATWRAAARRHIAGTVALHGQVAGPPLQLDGALQLSAVGLSIGEHEVGDVGLNATGMGGAWTLKGAAFGASLDLAATLRSGAALPYTLDVTWRDTNIARLMLPDPRVQATTSGVLKLAGSLQALAASSGTLRVTRLEARRDQGYVEAAEPIEVDLEAGHFRIGSLVLAAPGSRLTVAGDGTVAGDVSLDVRGDGDLALLEFIGDPFRAARGQFGVTAQITRTALSGWQVSGQVALRDAVLDLGLPVAFTTINGRFTLAGSSVRIDTLTGRAGGGQFTVGGMVDLNRGPAISWNVQEVALRMPEWLEERLSGQGRVQGTWRQLTVSGDIEVLNALYDRRIELTDLVPWFKEQVAPAPRIEAPATEVHLDLHIHAPDGLFVDNNFAKVEMQANLQIAGTTEHPTLSGTIEILDGEVTFQKRTFTITGGSIEFQNPYRINPLLNITAESRISTPETDYTVSVAVSGTADEPRVQLSVDDPTLTQNDALTLITSGKTMAQLQREGGGVNVSDLLSLVPTGAVERQLGSLLRVDRFEVESVYQRETGAIAPRVTIGKDLTDRLSVLAASSLRVDAHNSIELEYRVRGRISLLGTWESATTSEAGAFGGGVKFRYEFRTIPLSLFGGDVDSTPCIDAP